MKPATLLLFARARETAGRARIEIDVADGQSLADLLAAARERFGPEFGAVLESSRVWVNGDEPVAGADTLVRPGDEVAVLPPVSGG